MEEFVESVRGLLYIGGFSALLMFYTHFMVARGGGLAYRWAAVIYSTVWHGAMMIFCLKYTWFITPVLLIPGPEPVTIPEWASKGFMVLIIGLGMIFYGRYVYFYGVKRMNITNAVRKAFLGEDPEQASV